MQKIIEQKEDGFWYFWNESWTIEYGPYDTKKKAIKAWRKYCRENELVP